MLFHSILTIEVLPRVYFYRRSRHYYTVVENIGRITILLSSFVFSLIASLIMFSTSIFKKFPEFIGIAIALMIMAFQPLVLYLVLEILPAEYALAKLLLTLMFQGVAIAFILLLFSITKLSGNEIGYRVLLEFFAMELGTNYLTASLHPVYNNGWHITFTPNFAHLAMGVPLVLIIFDMLQLSFPRKSIKTRSSRMIIDGWLILCLSVLIAFIERYTNSNTTYYQIGVSLGFLFIAIALYKDPFVFIPHVVEGNFLLISEKKSGNRIYSFRFDNHERVHEQLFSPAMKGILDVMCEITGQENIPEDLGYKDLKIVVAHSERLLAYFVCRKSISPLRKILERLLKELEEENFTPSLDIEVRRDLDRRLPSEFAFAL